MLKHVLDSFYYCYDLFLSFKICILLILFLNQKRICIFLRRRSEFFLNKKWICIFLRCRFEFFLNKKWICIFLRCRFELFLNQKLICIFIRCRSTFFFQIKNWSTFSLDVDLIFNIESFEIKKDHEWLCLFYLVHIA